MRTARLRRQSHGSSKQAFGCPSVGCLAAGVLALVIKHMPPLMLPTAEEERCDRFGI